MLRMMNAENIRYTYGVAPSLTDAQALALSEMADRSIGALLVLGVGWVWPENIRESESVAERVLDVLRNEDV